ncbi:hypothetical protein WAI453_009982 [Rhynchosporium graminicola]|uniref:2EXR domain-containing protein n=1 Tax=Rhynchosporium graminicola TaxID=2792576 RepID=A0A1E1KEM0_9HELO|nr:uncharacterized protein RCO7_04859 [Rhynchosporium commune]
MCSLNSFLFFPLLSPELRIQIWHEALLMPRLVHLWKHDDKTSSLPRRSVVSPLLCASRESRNEALRVYSPPVSYSQLLKVPAYIGPGTDIVYISGTDGDRRVTRNVTRTCDLLSCDLDSMCPSFASIRRLAIDEDFLQQTPCVQFKKMPYSVWKLIVFDLRDLDELIIVRRQVKLPWTVREVQERLAKAQEKFLDFWTDTCEDEIECQTLMKWRMPVVTILTVRELIGMCWF